MITININNIDLVSQAINDCSMLEMNLSVGDGSLWTIDVPSRSEVSSDTELIEKFLCEVVCGFVKAWDYSNDTKRYNNEVSLIEKPKVTISDNIVG